MGEPWLDSLSEDWNSEPHLSSPAASLPNSKYGTHSSNLSQSRIPHLAHSMRRDSSSGSFLKPRSSRGIAKAKGLPILSERSASSLNLPGLASLEGSQKRATSAAVARRTSSNFSSSQQSVQHHSVEAAADETPEWKRRIQKGEDVASDGFDLFSPSKLEGMFSQPAQSTPDQEIQLSMEKNDNRPWTSLKYSNNQPSAEKYHSFRTSRSRAPPMAALPELTEDEEDKDTDHSMSAISSDLIRDGSMRGLVQKRVGDLEKTHEVSSPQSTPASAPASRDPRWRTLSGQQELRDEYISPVTASTKNTISAKAVRESVEINPSVLRQKLMNMTSDQQRRPSSRSSDREVSYNGLGNVESMIHEETLEDMTSHSLPEDLSMGTQDFISNGGYINSRRGPASNEPSFLKKKLSSIHESSIAEHGPSNDNKFRSSPPPYQITQNSVLQHSTDDIEFPSSYQDGSVVHHESSPQRPNSAGSPLKLFGNRDTYTNNKLLRVLSQYEQDRSDDSHNFVKPSEMLNFNQEHESGFRMSQFGKGELDTYNFDKEVTRLSPQDVSNQLRGERIFQSFIDLTIDDEGTIPGIRPSVESKNEDNIEDLIGKRLPSSPAKDRTSKRRRTFVRDEIVVEEIAHETNALHVSETTSLAGTKRKDARPGEGGMQADPDVLASRAILQPKPGSRKSSGNSQNRSTSQDSTIKRTDAPKELAEALAIELASFAQGVSKAQLDSRKPSLATKDYMEEANKVMEFIRARGKPKTRLSEIQEPVDSTELEADRILDLEVEDDSTVEPFSRPPSREGPTKPREDRRVAKHDPQTASHLQKFKDSDDLEVLATISGMGTLNIAAVVEKVTEQSPPIPVEQQQSSPPNIRILGHTDTQRKRKHSASTNNDQTNANAASESSTRQTFTTESSNSSGQKGMITSGKVSIPDNIGTMTFDHDKQIWVKQHLAKVLQEPKPTPIQPVVAERHEEATLEDDPFEDIPDLSIDEEREAAMRVVPRSSSRPATAESIRIMSPQAVNSRLEYMPYEADMEVNANTEAFSDQDEDAHGSVRSRKDMYERKSASIRSEASKHEERLHQGIPSRPPPLPGTPSKQARVVTIAFSSPVALDIPQSVVEIAPPQSDDDDDEDFLPPDDSEDDTEYLKTPKAVPIRSVSYSTQRQALDSSNTRSQQTKANTLTRRPISRIEEIDEETEQNENKSLIQLQHPEPAVVPANRKAPNKSTPAYKGTSILCLTPLSEFTVHQADRANHPEESFVQQRAHPKALLQAHGALALSVDTLVKAITDAIPTEPFWEQLRKLDLKDSRLQSVHGLQDYCSSIEMLNISQNQIAQLDGLPSSLRHLDASHNKVNDFTSWGHLQNLQYVDVSNNQLENLEGFSSLIHMRKLRCRDNSIRDVEGILDLDGLISLDLRGNQLDEIDFEGVDMARLEELDLSNNKLTVVRNLQCLPMLRKLDLSDNHLHDLPVLEPLTGLKTLKISGNQLEFFDLDMYPALTELNLDGNSIKDIAGLSRAVQLRKLSICDQRNSANIVDFVLTTPNECSEIHLSSNVVFQGQPKLPKYPHYNLRRLELAACGLRSLPVGFGDYFPNCRSLNLNFNAISELSCLLGMIKLQRLHVAENRVNRLRRTCLTLSRLPALEQVDLRNNPLTVGFYAPDQGECKNDAMYVLPRRSVTQDLRWLELLDETTALRRKMIELLLMQGCPMLKELDGLPFSRHQVGECDATWTRLTSKGVLMKTIEAPPAQSKSPSAIEMPIDTTQREEALIGVNGNNGIVNGLALERSLLVE